MTTKKKYKFTIQPSFIYNHGYIVTFDRIANDGESISTFKICDLLNKLYEENEQLKEKADAMEKVLENMLFTVEYDNQEKRWRIE